MEGERTETESIEGEFERKRGRTARIEREQRNHKGMRERSELREKQEFNYHFTMTNSLGYNLFISFLGKGTKQQSTTKENTSII